MKTFPTWEEIFNDVDFGDIRRNTRAIKLAESIETKFSNSASSSLPDKASLKAASRFLQVESVTPEKLMSDFRKWNFKNLGCNHILVVQDTTELNYSWRKTMLEGLGPVTKKGNQGFFLHPGIIVNPDNESVLGLASAYMWSREHGEKSTENEKYKYKPIEQKESYRWLMVPEDIQEYIKDDLSYTVVADREADIYELFHAYQEGKFGDNCELLIRASQNRKIEDEDTTLFHLVEKWPIMGEFSIDIEANHKQQKRKADLEIKYGEVTLSIPYGKKSRIKDEVSEIYVIDVKEKNSLSEDSSLHWTLLTTYKINTLEEAIEKVNWYKCRWFIEEVFRILKSGYKVEKVKFDSAHALMNWCALRLMMAIRLLYLLTQRDVDVADSAIPFFSKDEIKLMEKMENMLISPKSTIKRPPKKSFAWTVLIIAILGGYKATPSAKPPGQESLWRGLDRLDAALFGFLAASN